MWKAAFARCFNICAYAHPAELFNASLFFGFLLILSVLILSRILLVMDFSHCTAFHNGTRKESVALQLGEAQLLEAR